METGSDLRLVVIDHNKIAEAMHRYALAGYVQHPVPWIVGREAYDLTRPPAARDHATLGGFLVASAEQGYVQLMLEGKLPPGRWMTTSPCFRDEPVADDLHRQYFEKLELIDYMPSEHEVRERLVLMKRRAKEFFDLYLKVRFETTGELSEDIVSHRHGIELGSYGVRRYREHVWIYGTGVAEPRLSQAVWKEKTR